MGFYLHQGGLEIIILQLSQQLLGGNMGVAVLPQDLMNKQEPAFYTADELDLLHKLENGLVETASHEQVMENLRKTLGLTEK